MTSSGASHDHELLYEIKKTLKNYHYLLAYVAVVATLILVVSLLGD